jgi:hypothetical protein
MATHVTCRNIKLFHAILSINNITYTTKTRSASGAFMSTVYIYLKGIVEPA